MRAKMTTDTLACAAGRLIFDVPSRWPGSHTGAPLPHPAVVSAEGRQCSGARIIAGAHGPDPPHSTFYKGAVCDTLALRSP